MPEERMAANGCLPDSADTHKFPKTSRLRKSWEFERVYQQGRRLSGAGFTLIFKANGMTHSRLGISVYRKLHGAQKRNRIKRILRETFRINTEIFPSAADIVIAVRSADAFTTYWQACQVITQLSRDVVHKSDER